MLRKLLLIFLLGAWPAAFAATEQQRTLFLRAEQALGQGRLAEARQFAASLADYPLYPYLLYKILSDDRADANEIPPFLERYGHTRHAAPLRKKWLEHLVQREAWSEFLRDYRETENVQLQCDYYWVLHRLGRDREAFAGAEKLWASGDPRPSACDRLFAAWQATPAFTSEQFWKRFGLALRKKQLGLATYLRNMIPGRDQPLADFWFGVHENPRLAEQCGNWVSGDPVNGRIFAHGIDRLAADAPMLAQNLWNLRRSDFAIDREVQGHVDRRLALALATDRYPQALAYLSYMPEGVADAQVRAWRVRAALIKQDWPGVLDALDQLDAAEKKQAQWRYWRARALEALGDRTAAAELYRQAAGERDLYGFAAADRLRQRYALSFAPLPIADGELQRLADSEPFLRVREFRALNRQGEASSEWMHALKTLPARDIAVAARLAQQWGWDRLAISTIAKAGNYDDLTVRFPLSYYEPVLRQARERQLDPALVYSLIRRESAFDAAAKSSVGALGLMQLMPGTAQYVARLLNEPGRADGALLEPELNLRYGTAYFKNLMDHFGQHFALAAAAYNAGPGKVDRWLPAARPVPADIWIETIPYLETRQYVSAVLGYAIIYRGRLGGEAGGIGSLLAEVAPGGKADVKPDQAVPVTVCR
jgi:soluble lytic murein transglycosylase